MVAAKTPAQQSTTPRERSPQESLTRLQVEVCSDLCDLYLKRPQGASLEFREAVESHLGVIQTEISSTRSNIYHQVTSAIKSISNLSVPKNEQVPKGQKKIPRDSEVIKAEENYKRVIVKELTAISDKYAAEITNTPKSIDLGLHHTLAEKVHSTTSEFVAFLAEQLGPCGTTRWNGHNLGYAMHLLGFEQHSSWQRDPQALELVKNFIGRLDKCRDRIEVEPLQSLVTRAASLRSFLPQLVAQELDAKLFEGYAKLLSLSPGQLSEPAVAYAFHQLSSFLPHTLSPAGRDAYLSYVDALTSRLESMQPPASQGTIGSAFYGLSSLSPQNLAPESTEKVLQIVTNLTTLLEKNTEVLTPQTICSVSTGIKELDSADLGPRGASVLTGVVSLLEKKIQEIQEPLTPIAAASVVFGCWTKLTCTDTSLQLSVQSLIRTALNRASYDTSNINHLTCLADSARVLFSVRDTFAKDIQRIFSIMAEFHTPSDCGWRGELREGLDDQSLITAFCVVSHTYHLYGLSPNATVAETLKEIYPIATELAAKNRSQAEKRVEHVLKRFLDCQPYSSVVYWGLELDLLLSTQSGYVNIEVDGPHHSLPAQQKSDAQRSAFLKQQGVSVIRIPWDVSPEDLLAAVGHLQPVDLKGQMIRPKSRA